MFIVFKQILKIYNIENSNSVVFYIVTLKYIEVNRDPTFYIIVLVKDAIARFVTDYKDIKIHT